MQITAGLVKELRERTGAGMMDCKKALEETGGDIETAIEAMRKSGVAKAARKAGRIAAEGSILIQQDTDSNDTIILEINSETDFVAKDENFKSFAGQVATTILQHHPADIDELMSLPVKSAGGTTVEEIRQQMVAKLGENISVRRFDRVNAGANLATYLHGTRIGVVVELDGGDEALAKDVALHIAGHLPPPVCISESGVPAELLEKEREIFSAQASESGKPPEIVKKMIDGKMARFIKEITLLGQDFVKDQEITVEELLAKGRAQVKFFIRYEVGEGLEKRSNNFAEEVMAQARGE